MMWSIRTPPACRSVALTTALKRLVGQFDQLIGAPRRLRPVLPQLVELVGWGTGADAERQNVLQCPRVRTVGVDAHGKVVDDAEGHPRLDGRDLSSGQLVVELPLQPAMEVDQIGVLGGEGRNRLARRVPQLLRPPVPVVAVLVGQRAPRGEVVEAARPHGPGRRRRRARALPTAPRSWTLFSAARLIVHTESRSIRSEASAPA